MPGPGTAIGPLSCVCARTNATQPEAAALETSVERDFGLRPEVRDKAVPVSWWPLPWVLHRRVASPKPQLAVSEQHLRALGKQVEEAMGIPWPIPCM